VYVVLVQGKRKMSSRKILRNTFMKISPIGVGPLEVMQTVLVIIIGVEQSDRKKAKTSRQIKVRSFRVLAVSCLRVDY
jgi:hypothetical protein